jgi:hypothetical protein
MGVVSFRISDRAETAFRAAGINPGTLAKEHVEREARRLDAAETMRAVTKHARKPKQAVAKTIRETRREH